jgi:hypothetical protein
VKAERADELIALWMTAKEAEDLFGFLWEGSPAATLDELLDQLRMALGCSKAVGLARLKVEFLDRNKLGNSPGER